MLLRKGLLCSVLFVFVFFVLFLDFAPIGFWGSYSYGQDQNYGEIEQRLLEEILTLDSRVLALQNEVERLSAENALLKKSLAEKRRELTLLNENVSLRQWELSRWILFSFKGGMGNMLSVLVGAEDLGDFFRRFDNIMFFMEYYNNIIVETNALISYRKQEEKSIMEEQREIESLEDQAKIALDKITQTIAEKQKELNRARFILKDTMFLEEISESWQKSLPSLDYLLKNLSSLPWSTLGPDNLKVNYFTLTAWAEFHDTSITKTLLSKNENLKNVYFSFSNDGITVAEKNPQTGTTVYSITCTMDLTEDQRIKFTPKRLEFNGITLPTKVIDELMKDYDMVFSPPPLPYDLKITSVSTEKGKLIMNFKK